MKLIQNCRNLGAWFRDSGFRIFSYIGYVGCLILAFILPIGGLIAGIVMFVKLENGFGLIPIAGGIIAFFLFYLVAGACYGNVLLLDKIHSTGREIQNTSSKVKKIEDAKTKHEFEDATTKGLVAINKGKLLKAIKTTQMSFKLYEGGMYIVSGNNYLFLEKDKVNRITILPSIGDSKTSVIKVLFVNGLYSTITADCSFNNPTVVGFFKEVSKVFVEKEIVE